MFLDHRVCFVSRRAQSISDIKKSLKPPLINRIAPLTRLPVMRPTLPSLAHPPPLNLPKDYLSWV